MATRRTAALALLSIIAGILGYVAAHVFRSEDPPPPPLRLSLSLPHHPLGLALAPDGRRLAYLASAAGGATLWIHDLSSGAGQAIRDSDGAMLPFWSADGRLLAFFSNGKLRALDVDAGAIHDVADAPLPHGGTWNDAGEIVFAPDDRGLRWRRADGRIEPLTTLEGGERSHRHPQFVAGNTHVVFFVDAAERTRHGIWIVPLDRPGSRRRLTGSDANGIPVDRTLVYSSGGALVAQPMDLDSLSLSGRPTLLDAAVGSNDERQLLAAAGGDTLIVGEAASRARRLQWVDRQGEPAGAVGEPMDAWDVRVAPGGRTIAVTRSDPQLKTLDVWTYDDQRPLPRRISPNIDVDESPAWSRDGARLAWVSASRVVTLRDAQAARAETPIRKFDHAVRITDWAGEWIVVSEARPGAGQDIVLVAADGGAIRPAVQTPFNETDGVVSPDRRWLAYASDESGQPEIYADRFPAPRTRARLSVGGGTEPRWSRDGGELYFRRGREVHAVRLAVVDDSLQAVSSERLFDAGTEIRSFDVAPDAQRFLLNLPAAQSEAKPLRVILNARSLFGGPSADD